MEIVSLFAGAGGLDLGFKRAGFRVAWANEFDKHICPTFARNFPDVALDSRSIAKIPSEEIPACDGVIGGPPCQSWSRSGSRRGIKDGRGQLFYEYIRVLRDKRPLFFLAENVGGILHQRHAGAWEKILETFREAGYTVRFKLLNANDFGIPQERLRVFIIGYRSDLRMRFEFPQPPEDQPKRTLREAIGDLVHSAEPALANNLSLGDELPVPNHEFWNGGFSSIFMSRNRVRGWDEPGFTVQATGRQAQLHPQAPKMPRIGKDEHEFVAAHRHLYRRLTIRECARLQTFPDDFVFVYRRLEHGYRMVGNAVPPLLGEVLAKVIFQNLIAHRMGRRTCQEHFGKDPGSVQMELAYGDPKSSAP
ncbi:MAG: DNA cytosine methyltransferase [Verrucomicrobiales bacterium]